MNYKFTPNGMIRWGSFIRKYGKSLTFWGLFYRIHYVRVWIALVIHINISISLGDQL